MSQILTNDSFRIPSVGVYEYDGRMFTVIERLSNYGTGKKTVYSFSCDGVIKERQDINQVKRFFGVVWSGSAKSVKTAPKEPRKTEPKPAPAIVVKPSENGIIRHEKYTFIKNLLQIGFMPYLYGPAGSGKNVIAQQIADDLGLPFYYSNSVSQEFKIAGFVDANGRFHETEFYRAFKNGGVFMLDELDASIPEVLTMLNAALGDVDQVVLPTRYIYQQLCIESACGAILVHTHPSGDPTPSNADIQMTRKIRSGLDTLGIRLLDHVIISPNKFYSFADEQITDIEK